MSLRYPINTLHKKDSGRSEDSYIMFIANKYKYPQPDGKDSKMVKAGEVFSCSIAIPGGISERYSSNWESSKIASFLRAKETFSIENVLQNVLGSSKALIGDMGGMDVLSNTIESVSGVTILPSEILVFKSMNYNDFSISLEMTPTNKQEAEVINAIVSGFKKSIKPEAVSENAQLLVHFPPLFDIKIITGGKKNRLLFKYEKMALIDLSISYSNNNNSFLSYEDGNPVSTNISLSFKSIEPHGLNIS